jgi:hypothetical protein
MSPAAFLKGQQKGSPVSRTAEVSESLPIHGVDATTALAEPQAGFGEWFNFPVFAAPFH